MRPTLPAPLLNAAFSAFLAFRHKEGAPVIGAPSLANFSSRVFPDDPHTFSDLVPITPALLENPALTVKLGFAFEER